MVPLYSSRSASAAYRVAKRHAAKTGQWVHRPTLMEPRPGDVGWFQCFGSNVLLVTWKRVRVDIHHEDTEEYLGSQWMTIYKVWSIYEGGG